MCEICERVIVAKEHQYHAIEHCLQHCNLLEAAEKEKDYEVYLSYLFSLVLRAAEQQTVTTGEVTNNIRQITEVVQQPAKGAEKTTCAAAQLARQATDLQSLVGRFRLVA
jgi:methyl-accepting chemotaxis protein